jgi:hypothetical protein
VEDICRQVLYHERLAPGQQSRLGPDRFMIVRHEDICYDPRSFVETVGHIFLHTLPDFGNTDPTLESFAIGQPAGDGELLASIRETLTRLDAEREFPAPDSFRTAG